MTDYIEEMMKTAGVEPDNICKYAANNIVYPDFTPEKQIEIIKLTGKTTAILIKQDCIFYGFETNNPKDLICIEGDFTQALAQLTTELMNADELDKEKVKGILEK